MRQLKFAASYYDIMIISELRNSHLCKAMQDLKVLASDIRREVTEKKNSAKTTSLFWEIGKSRPPAGTF